MSDVFDSDKAIERCSAMWLALGEQIACAIPDIVTNDQAQRAIRWATYAEACFWKATGECDSHYIKDVLPPSPQSGGAE